MTGLVERIESRVRLPFVPLGNGHYKCQGCGREFPSHEERNCTVTIHMTRECPLPPGPWAKREGRQ